MKFELKQYDETRTYVAYSDERKQIAFTNAEYFMFDVTSSRFAEIMKDIGGFTANMTTRHIKEKELDAKYIMLCSVPQEDAYYLFAFVYLDVEYHILSKMLDDNYFDYQYFKERFTDCIVKEGFIYELEEIEALKDLTDTFHSSHELSYGFKVEGKPVQFGDIFYSSNLSVFRDDVEGNLKALGIEEIQFTLDLDYLGFIMLKGNALTKEGNLLLDYQAESGIWEKAKYIKKQQETDPEFSEEDVADEPFEFRMKIKMVKKMIDKLQFYRKEEDL